MCVCRVTVCRIEYDKAFLSVKQRNFMQERGRSEFADVIGQCPEPASGEISTVIYDVKFTT